MATAKVVINPIKSEATNAPINEPRPPTTITTKTMGPSTIAIPGKVPKTGPAITPANPARAEPTKKFR